MTGNRAEAGFSLVEAIAATVIGTIAVIGLAYSFSLGRSFINRFEVARAGLGVAQQRLDLLRGIPKDSLGLLAGGSTHVRSFQHGGREVGTEEWTVSWFDDPATAGANDLKRVTVRVLWSRGSIADTVTLTRLFLPD